MFLQVMTLDFHACSLLIVAIFWRLTGLLCSLQVNFVPISGFQGDNMIEKSDNMSWYKVRRDRPFTFTCILEGSRGKGRRVSY
jgi:hypothetical protein